jgi:hypothetical protein
LTRRRLPIGLLIVAAAALLASACGGGASTASTDSGIQGSVILGPTCPVEQVGVPCPDQPVEANITVTRVGSGQILKHGRSSADGSFRIALRPGRYLVAAQPIAGQAGVGGSAPLIVSVSAHQFAPVTIRIDSGIR